MGAAMGLIDEARHWWRLWSVQFYALIGVGVGFVCDHPEALTGLVAYIPPYWRPAAASAFSLTVFVILPAILRLMKQRLPDGK